ncbi:MAG TPA: carboxylesterase family protein [Herpetosiphonaceae bacterium]
MYSSAAEHITIFGELAGAVSSAALLTMPAAQGLYQQAILHSGAAQVQLPEQASVVARAILEQLGVTPGNLATLRDIPGEIILQTATAVQSAMGGSLTFLPVLDGATLLALTCSTPGSPSPGAAILALPR